LTIRAELKKKKKERISPVLDMYYSAMVLPDQAKIETVDYFVDFLDKPSVFGLENRLSDGAFPQGDVFPLPFIRISE